MTKAIEKDNIIEELKEDMDRVIEKYNVVDEENIALKTSINELRLRLGEIHQELSNCYDLIEKKDKEMIEALEKQKFEILDA